MKSQMRRMFVVIITLLIVGALPSCTGDDDPEDVLSQYFKLVQSDREEEANKLLSRKDQDIAALPDFREVSMGRMAVGRIFEMEETESEAFYKFLQDNLINFEIGESRNDGDDVLIQVTLRYLDIFTLSFEVADTEPELNKESLDPEEKNKLYKAALKTLYGESDPPIEVVEEKIRMIREKGEWRAIMNLEADYIEGKVFRLSWEAWEAGFSDDNKLAADLYRQALVLDPDNYEVKAKLAEVEAELAEMQAVLDHPVDIYVKDHITMTEINIEGEGSFKEIIFSANNSGDRRISGLKIRVEYLEEDGQILAAEILEHQICGRNLEPSGSVSGQKT